MPDGSSEQNQAHMMRPDGSSKQHVNGSVAVKVTNLMASGWSAVQLLLDEIF